MFRQFREIKHGEFFLVAGDCSQGGGDFNATQFFSVTNMDVPLVYHARGVAAQQTNEIQPVLEKIKDTTGIKPVIALERNNGGASEMERLAAMNHSGKYDLFTFKTQGQVEERDTNKLGWDTTSATRGAMCGDLKNAIDSKVITIYDKATIDQMYSFIKVYRAGKWQGEAEKGMHDDLIMSLAIVWQLYQIVPLRRIQQPFEQPKYEPSDSIIGI